MDLNDLRYFALIVEHGGFTAAERHVHITKSKLSRRVAVLEDRLGVRLVQRSTRRLSLTEAGRVFYEHCAAMLVEAEAAHHAVDALRSEPSGTVRLTCPLTMAQFYVARLVADFMRRYPKVRIELDATDRVVNLIEERVDVALRARITSTLDPALTARRIASTRLILAASAAYAATLPPDAEPETLARHDTVGALADGPDPHWNLTATDGRTARVAHRPRLLCSDLTVQYHAALEGVGIGLLPQRIVWGALGSGKMVRLAKDWASPDTDIHLVYVSRRGMLPAVRALIDHLAATIPTALFGVAP